MPARTRQPSWLGAAHRCRQIDTDGARRHRKLQPLGTAEFATLRMRLIKIARRPTKTATRVCLALAAASLEAESFSEAARSRQPPER